jgi:hypothetical protein
MGKLINIIGYKLMFSAKYHLMYEKKLLLNSFHSINFNLFLWAINYFYPFFLENNYFFLAIHDLVPSTKLASPQQAEENNYHLMFF